MQSSKMNESRSPRFLPPLLLETECCCQSSSDKSHKSPTDKQWSRYLKGCASKGTSSNGFTWAKLSKKNRKSDKTKRIHKYEAEITDYLDINRDFLENYVINNISSSDLQMWLLKKASDQIIKVSPSNKINARRGQKETSSKRQIFTDVVKKLKQHTSEHLITSEIANFMCSSIDVDAYRVYKLYPDHPAFVQYFDTDSVDNLKPYTRLVKADEEQVNIIIEVAKTGSLLNLSRHKNPVFFPKTPFSLLRTFGIEAMKEANHVLYQPILTDTGRTAYVVEMWRINDEFDNKDEELSSNFIVWGSLVLHHCNLYLDKKRERNLSDFLLDVVKAIFEEMVSLDQVIKRILEFAQKLVKADRASLFLVDSRNYELVSTVFDLKFESGQNRDMEKKEIRMPINRGIAGHVALSGETINIPDAYSDYRFNRDIDEATGYKTISILCMPVKVRGKVIGVVQMVNKRNTDNFDHEDEVSFEIFSTFFGLALHHAKLYDKIMRKEQKYKVALEILSYHNTCKENEVINILTDNATFTGMINDFYLDPYQLDDFQKCKAVITMFDDLFDLSKFNKMTLTRFILTVKKNYRTVPYHNFDHGWSVAQAMYVIIKNDVEERFDYKMRLALFVACLCHDLDHRGYTNKYMNETASPLAAMYTTSPLEHHHFNITVTILQQDGHNIFSHLSSEDYKDVLRSIKHCILATDLAVFFPNLAKLKDLINDRDIKQNNFNWEYPNHRDLGMAISMTAADLSASAKPWKIQIKTVEVIFKEFYDQGDKERAIGRTPIPMMDRNKPEEQAASQVGFLSQICIPCYCMLNQILPKTKPMFNMAMKNLNLWKTKATVEEQHSQRYMTRTSIDVTHTTDESENEKSNAMLTQKFAIQNKSNDNSEIVQDSSKIVDINVYDNQNKVKSILSRCESDALSWRDSREIIVNENKDNIWYDAESSPADDESVVTRSNRLLKK